MNAHSLEVVTHVGLLINQPLGFAEMLFA